ncbi:MAG: SDR family oxidoreductase [Victivallales bacterium]|nr:SDR family oxidoreductase [Victivallales bacterium]
MRILITGSAKRIGAAVARYFAEKGHAVVVHCNTSIKEAEALVASFPNPSIHQIVQMDLTLPDAPSKLFGILKKNPPDVLVNNASVYSRTPLADATPSVMQDAFNINFMIPFELMRCFHNVCKKGNIINILDHRVDHPDPVSGPYAFAKKSLRDATLAAAIDWAPEFRVNAVAPAFVLPPDGVPLEKMDHLIQASPTKVRPTPLDIARAIDYLLQTPCLTGEIIHLSSGLHLLSPEAVAQEKAQSLKLKA